MKVLDMRILIDTNIIIYREDYKVVPKNLSDLMNVLGKLSHLILIHPLSKEEILKDNDEKRKEINLSKISSYNEIENPPILNNSSEFALKLGKIKRENDYIDNNLLYSIDKNVANFLITEDKGILNKSQKIGLESKVLTIDDALIYFNSFIEKDILNQIEPFIYENCHNININDDIFTSLKSEYEEFESWWTNKCCLKGRKAWVCNDSNNNINAILIYKIENGNFSECEPSLKGDRLVKICLFKVSSNIKGNRVGERFIKMAIDFAIKNDIYSLYLTHFTTENDQLVSLINKFGFYKYGVNRRGEDIFFKEIIPKTMNLNNINNFNEKFYPSFYARLDVNKYIIPILPVYHRKLFPDYHSHSHQLRLIPAILNSEGNSIKKAYLSNSKNKQIKKGDILLFYGSNDYQAVTSICTIENIFFNLTNASEIYDKVFNRSVYTLKEIEEFSFRKKTMVILFWHHFHLNKFVPLDTLRKENILKAQPQSITKIDHYKFIKLLKKGELDERFIVY
ncbi:MAG: hypothetical protein PHV68_03730 [Candidatus Gastranaerophilales bacterium]|nr:hypothetical protein [Candidatus Gastranaerophilales bacterium]